MAGERADGSLEPLEHDAVGTRLGAGLRERGRLDPEAAERTLSAVAAFMDRVRACGARPVCIATSALRRADDAAAFAERMSALTGAALVVLDGADEAAGSFRGAMAGVPSDGRRRAVLDVGGGSTECAVGTDGNLEDACSVEIGSVRLTERFPDLAGRAPGVPARAAAAAARAFARDALAGLAALGPVAELRCVAGTPLTLGAIAAGTSVEAVAGHDLFLAEVDSTVERLLDLPLAERCAVPGMIAQRADILPAGGLLVAEAMRQLGVERARIETNDLLLGYLLAGAKGG